MGKAESTGTVERQGNPTAYTYGGAHTRCTHERCMACSDGDDAMKPRQGGWRVFALNDHSESGLLGKCRIIRR